MRLDTVKGLASMPLDTQKPIIQHVIEDKIMTRVWNQFGKSVRHNFYAQDLSRYIQRRRGPTGPQNPEHPEHQAHLELNRHVTERCHQALDQHFYRDLPPAVFHAIGETVRAHGRAHMGAEAGREFEASWSQGRPHLEAEVRRFCHGLQLPRVAVNWPFVVLEAAAAKDEALHKLEYRRRYPNEEVTVWQLFSKQAQALMRRVDADPTGAIRDLKTRAPRTNQFHHEASWTPGKAALLVAKIYAWEFFPKACTTLGLQGRSQLPSMKTPPFLQDGHPLGTDRWHQRRPQIHDPPHPSI